MTPTQGEHAQTELAHELFAAAQLAPGEGIEDAVSRITAALTAAPSVSDGLRTLHDAILNRLSHAELLEKAHCLMELNSNQARTIGELQDLVEAATAQPAAPQGVAYAGLPDEHAAFETWARLRSDWRPNLERKGDGYVGAFADEAWRGWSARASHGQAPAGVALEELLILLGSKKAWPSYYFNHKDRYECCDCGEEHDDYAEITHAETCDFTQATADRKRIKELVEILKSSTPTAQAAPAAGAVAGPVEPAVPIPLADAQHLLSWMDEQFGNDDGDDWFDADAASVADGLDSAVQRFLRAHPPTPAAQADSVQDLQSVHDAVTIELLNERVAYLEGKLKEADSVREDAARWQFVRNCHYGMVTFRLHNLRPDQREQYVDAARKQGGKHD